MNAATTTQNDCQLIRTLILRQFDSMQWQPGSSVNWADFSKSFLKGAAIIPAKRPACPVTPDAFVARMTGLRNAGALSEFHETGNGLGIFVLGNIAVAMAGCEMLENARERTWDVSVFLLVKTDGDWKIASQAWDSVTKAFEKHDIESCLKFY